MQKMIIVEDVLREMFKTCVDEQFHILEVTPS